MLERLRAEDAVYGREISAHHYSRNFTYCDSGMIPWLLIAETLCKTGEKLSTLVKERIQVFPCSGEINFEVPKPALVMESVFSAIIFSRTDYRSYRWNQYRISRMAF